MPADDPQPSAALLGDGEELHQAMLESFDGLRRALELEAVGADRYVVPGEPGRFQRVFGGQSLAQALVAAGDTVEGREPHSLHAYFVQAGVPGEPVEIEVERVRDGRSFATRHVSVRQGERALLTAIASFHSGPPGDELADPAPDGPPPEELPRLQDWVPLTPAPMREHAQSWVDTPPPVELRMAEPPTFMGGSHADGSRSHWMRMPAPVGDDALLNRALLAYASDYFLLDMVMRSQPDLALTESFTAVSLDHAIWFHRPVRFDEWHVHTQTTQAISGERGLVRGLIHDTDGHLVASVVQEVLARRSR